MKVLRRLGLVTLIASVAACGDAAPAAPGTGGNTGTGATPGTGGTGGVGGSGGIGGSAGVGGSAGSGGASGAGGMGANGGSDGACNNVADIAAITASDPIVRQIAADCGLPDSRCAALSSTAFADCVTTCVEEAVTGLSAACASCYGEEALCSFNNGCLSSCGSTSGTACGNLCRACESVAGCAAALIACTGRQSEDCET